MDYWSRFRLQNEPSSVYSSYFRVREDATPWLGIPDERVFPFAVACVALGLQLLHALVAGAQHYLHRSAFKDEDDGSVSGFAGYVRKIGGLERLVFMVARLAGGITLLGLSVATRAGCKVEPSGMWQVCGESYMTATYAYSIFLSILSLISQKWRHSSTTYNVFVLFASFAVYAYRDLWPLATYDLSPVDHAEGPLLWAKVSTLAFTAIFIPLFIPRQYEPVDPKNPVDPNPEQTASLASLMTYFWMDPVINDAAKTDHLAADRLPPQADYDYAQTLKRRGFKHLDVFSGAKKGRHIFWGIILAGRPTYTLMVFAILVQAAASFVSPIGINRVLAYLETGGANSTIRPWFWILCLALGPLCHSLALQRYTLLATQVLVRNDALLTELVFEHAFRIRLKAETADEPKKAVEGSSQLASATASGASTPAKKFGSGTTTPTADGSQTPRNEASESTVVVSREPSTTSNKGKAKAKEQDQPKAPTKKKDGNFIGRLNNLVTTDLGALTNANDFLIPLLFVPIQMTGCIIFLYKVLGWSAFVGFGLTMVLMSVPGFILTRIRKYQVQRMEKTDARVQAVTEAVNILRMVKLFGWEKQMSDKVKLKRDDEVAMLRKVKMMEICNALLSWFLNAFTMIATFATYAIFIGEPLTPSKIFSSITVFELFRNQLQRVIFQVNWIIQGKVSLDRIGNFLKETELLDAYDADAPLQLADGEVVTSAGLVDREEIGFKNATFTWSKDEAERSEETTDRTFRLRIEDELFFKKGKINLIIGPTGSGKTSILMALLSEMHFIPDGFGAESWYSLPRAGGIAYAAQESWVQNETIRNNIIFGSPYDEERYKKVIKQCALQTDLELFEAGDQTEVGERGLTLSGGQKARVTLARAIYSSAEIILLDDVLAALDVHTSTWIVENCLQGDLVQGRTVLLVTHNVALASPVADYIVSIGLDGKIVAKSNDVSLALSRDATLAAEVQKDREAIEIGKSDIQATESVPKDAKPGQGKLVLAEEIATGHVSKRAFMLLMRSLGGAHPFIFFATFISGFVLTEVALTFQSWFLGYWGSQYETRDPSEVSAAYYLGLYCAILSGIIVIYSFSYLWYLFGTIRAAKAINALLMDSIFRSTLRWLDETPTGRIITRCTQDIRVTDGPLSQMFIIVIDCLNGLLVKLAAIVLFTPVFIIPGILVFVLGVLLGQRYMKAQMSVKRESSNAKSPVISHFSAAINGLVSIRAYAAQNAFINQSLTRLNHYIHTSRTSYNLNRWMSVRIDFLGAIFTSALATYLVYGKRVGSANTGFSLAMAAEFAMSILWFVRMVNEFEVQSNSLERIQGYIDIEHEPPSTESGKPPASWPTSGDLRVEKLSARYSKDGPEILHQLSFEIKSGERVGVVGRTGSGKSSLTLALLRCILTEGTVYYDGLPTNKLNLEAVRSNITIIPQIPELISGTLRHNLDPFEQTDDAVLNDALRAAGLFALQEEAGEARLTLDSKIAGGGGNLSVGQRQILALARAMIRGSKVLILDEATSAIDYKTDAIIQSTLRTELAKDVTVITIAHRLQTIMDADKIMVLDGGNIVEFDQPKVLLNNEKSALRALVEGSGDKDALYKLADS